MRRTHWVVCLFLVSMVGTALAQPVRDHRRRRPPPVRVTWDSTGWTLLGEQTIRGRVDHDRIRVRRWDGSFTRLMLVARDSDFELIDFVVTFGNGERWRPAVSHYFRQGRRTRSIDLPGRRRSIRHIDVRYRNLPGGGRARLQIWGRAGFDRPPPPPPPPRPSYGRVWDSRGWTMLGEQTVRGRVDRDRIRVGRHEGRFRKLMIVVLDSDLELLSFDVDFIRGPVWRAPIRQVFREGTRTRAIDLPGRRAAIRHIDLRYRNLRGGGRARIQVWGR